MRIGEKHTPHMVTPACSATGKTIGKRYAQKTKIRKRMTKRVATKRKRRKATKHHVSHPSKENCTRKVRSLYETDLKDEVASQFEQMLNVITMASINKKMKIDKKEDKAYTYIEVKWTAL